MNNLLTTGSKFKVEGSYAFEPTVYSNDVGSKYLAPAGNMRVGGIF